MKQILTPFLVASALLWCACGTGHQDAASTANMDTAHTGTDTAAMAAKTYDIALVNNKKDPTCGMPTSAGISDTAHYENKVIGFCSSECKTEFLKNPSVNIKAAALN
jgi:YHS domain-containing protein